MLGAAIATVPRPHDRHHSASRLPRGHDLGGRRVPWEDKPDCRHLSQPQRRPGRPHLATTAGLGLCGISRHQPPAFAALQRGPDPPGRSAENLATLAGFGLSPRTIRLIRSSTHVAPPLLRAAARMIFRPGGRRRTSASPTRSGPEGSSRSGSTRGSFVGLPPCVRSQGGRKTR